ncbi:hypothetical protein TrVE_jg7205 [Triparma verrucosa]|uniref:Cilia- and flagella-associated protein 300 n=1 Tax=Triparma verrucosa TaxID=1606542 RepID=A0A9W7CBT1_9STRA|nr:hypothetical protein TrVE_jg7205 [Triparma verrucosa]
MAEISATAFTPLACDFGFQKTTKAKDLLQKWNLSPDLKVIKFRIEGHMRRDPESLLATCKAVVSDPTVCASLGVAIPDTPDEIKIDSLSSTVLNMNFFDVLMQDDEVVTSTDMVRACMDETFDGVTIQDKLREMLVNSDSENGCIFTEAQKNEFIYHMLKLVVVGGSMCQSEEKFFEWKEMTKALYKDTVSVMKSAKTGKVEICSSAFHIDPWGSSPLFKKNNSHNKYYISLDPAAGTATIVYKPFVPFW